MMQMMGNIVLFHYYLIMIDASAYTFLPKLGLWFFLAQNQPFLDGNKRTAADAMLAFLYLNGFTFRRSDMQILKKDQFFLWVSEHAYQLNEPE